MVNEIEKIRVEIPDTELVSLAERLASAMLTQWASIATTN